MIYSEMTSVEKLAFLASKGLTATAIKKLTTDDLIEAALSKADPDYETSILTFVQEEADKAKASQSPKLLTHQTAVAAVGNHTYATTSDFRSFDLVENGTVQMIVGISAIDGSIIKRPINKRGIQSQSAMAVFGEGDFRSNSSYLSPSDVQGAITRGTAQPLQSTTLLNKAGKGLFEYAGVPVLMYTVNVTVSGSAAVPGNKNDYGKTVTIA